MDLEIFQRKFSETELATKQSLALQKKSEIALQETKSKLVLLQDQLKEYQNTTEKIQVLIKDKDLEIQNLNK